ncbi:class I SAM-dependent methyltransferase [Sulfuracidifex metallicus]|uniref:Methyltransferase domain-containing protein n=1 Tax=Sulfuracidifex metallicus DSM 6482 = JCM 9184 TaxID=523847 RepID=A0A6A9QID1_SULME|nr:class I SAM-dependent methyltransferase [Sulfuracidifex metallicus]MUN27909.1 methyltransferase domain-containing protein [Sulfuracidifex metallicus DSM 6482 = JCM 9184]
MKVDFGVYHHSTPEESNAFRERLERVLMPLLKSAFNREARINALDVGCGLGFLSWLIARTFPQGKVTCMDTFKGDSLSDVSVERAILNFRALKVEDRVTVIQHDLREPIDGSYDLIASNLFFHNLGKERFKVYENVIFALKQGGYFVISDMFSEEEDVKILEKQLDLIVTRTLFDDDWRFRVMILKKEKQY